MPQKRSRRKQQNAIQRYLRETVGELRKVSWPTREEAINLTRIVLLVIAFMAIFLGALDLLFTRLFAILLGS